MWPIIEAGFSSAARHRVALWRAKKDENGTRLSAIRHNVAVLKNDDLTVPAQQYGSQELFVLGSGPSVLGLTGAQFNRMRSGTTIGLNAWVLHDFIPDAYSFEEIENDDYIPVARAFSQAIARPEVRSACPLVLHLRPKPETPAARLFTFPDEILPRTRFYGRVSVETRLVRNLERDLTALLLAHKVGALAPQVLLDSGLSVARMVSLGILRDFKSIILIGIDLNSLSYFYEEDPRYLERRRLDYFDAWLGRTNFHATEERNNRAFVASEFLPALARASEAVNGPRIFVGSFPSKLEESLPLFDWTS
jgi:hypothetical protein